jgi:hypothetical protein
LEKTDKDNNMMPFPMSFFSFSMINTITTIPIRGHHNRKVKITPLALRNFPNPSTPPSAYRYIYPQYKHRGEHSVLYPPRAVQSSRVSYSGGGITAAYIVPPPCRRASPTYKTIGWVCSLRSLRYASFPPVANPSSTAQRGRGSPRP